MLAIGYSGHNLSAPKLMLASASPRDKTLHFALLLAMLRFAVASSRCCVLLGLALASARLRDKTLVLVLFLFGGGG